LAIERRNPVDYIEFKSASLNKDLNKKINSKLYKQLSTLGSGNHFIEIGEDKNGYVAITIHSGSRNIGWSIAQYYMNLSKLVDIDLPNGFLSLHSEYGQQYLYDMNFALDYALENRKTMMWEVLEILGLSASETYEAMNTMINENHNHAVVDKSNVLHRKGATPAEKGQIGIIPGSMKAGVYITEGLGNEDYLKSASHGAGRKMSRKKAKEKIDLNYVKKQMKGIVAKVDKSILDEAPDAYRDLEEVINMQEGIVIKTINFIKPLINVKG
jgi:tRNA-splicing ligase RtcB